MTKSADLIEAIRLEIRHAAETLTAPQDLTAWAGPRGILYVHVSAATGASLDGCRAKFQWHRSSTTEAEIAAMSIPLTPENFAGRAAVWDKTLPKNYIIHRLSEALDTGPDPVRTMYQVILGREPDDEGYAFWNGHFQDGIPLSELCRFMEREKAAGAK